jgi:splicing suppressor protein 51
VYKLLIDLLHLRQADDVNFENKTARQSIDIGGPSSIGPFRQYLAKAATRPNVLTPLWDAEKQKECKAFGESGACNDLRRQVSKQKTIDYYADGKVLLQVRMLTEAVYSNEPMEQDGTLVRRAMAQMESGGPGNGQIMSMLSI